MKLRSLSFFLVLLALLVPRMFAADAKPIKALLVTAGGYHDYDFQAKALTDATKKLGPIEWTIVNDGGKGTKAEIKLYENPNWAKAYDVVVHNECFADTNNIEYTRKIVQGHKGGTPAVVIHCAMHTYRLLKEDDWREFLGVTTRRHDKQAEYVVSPVSAAKNHPIMKGFPATWTTPMDELYVIEKLWPNSTALATAVSQADGNTYPTVWTNLYGGTRVVGTTWGHGNATWHDPVFLNLIAHAVFWAAGKE